MATFSTNQVKQLYVANAVNRTAGNKVVEGDAAGTIRAFGVNGDHLYFEYKGADNLMRSDIIKVGNIKYAKATPAADLVTNLKNALVTINSSALSGGAPIVGQDYILRIVLRQYIGMSDADLYYKYGMVHVSTGMTASQFYEKLADSLTKNFSREAVPVLKFSAVKVTDMTANTGVSAFLYEPTTTTTKIQFAVSAASESVAFASDTYTINMTATAKTLADAKRILAASQYADVIGLIGDDSITMQAEAAAITISGNTLTGVVITEVPQPWVLGKKEQVPVYFDVQSMTVTDSNKQEIHWADVDTKKIGSAGSINDGKKTADLEYFCLGERGDVYRGMGYPNNFDAKYLVIPDNAYSYLTIHYFYEGDNEAVQKSEKDIIIVASNAGYLNNLIDDVKTITGLTIAGV